MSTLRHLPWFSRVFTRCSSQHAVAVITIFVGLVSSVMLGSSDVRAMPLGQTAIGSSTYARTKIDSVLEGVLNDQIRPIPIDSVSPEQGSPQVVADGAGRIAVMAYGSSTLSEQIRRINGVEIDADRTTALMKRRPADVGEATVVWAWVPLESLLEVAAENSVAAITAATLRGGDEDFNPPGFELGFFRAQNPKDANGGKVSALREVHLALGPAANHTCAIVSGGPMWCWGANSHGQLGPNSSNTQAGLTLVPLPGRSGWSAPVIGWSLADTGLSHTCGITADSYLWCWGRNHLGQLGTNTVVKTQRPVQVLDKQGNRLKFLRVSAGADFTCALEAPQRFTVTGTFGAGTSVTGTLGSGLPNTASQSLVLVGPGKVLCWGKNTSGQVGMGSASNAIFTPTIVASAPPMTLVTAGYDHACGLDIQGQAWCWGSNSHGQLGNGKTGGFEAMAAPLLRTDLRFSALAAGYKFTCGATTSDVVCWGDDTVGQVTSSVKVPGKPKIILTPTARVGVQRPVSWLTAGGGHSCTVTSGVVLSQCWGLNLNGQTQSPLRPGSNPYNVSNFLPNQASLAFEQIEAGSKHTCAVVKGEVWCWGDNTNFQSGSNRSNRVRPQRAL